MTDRDFPPHAVAIIGMAGRFPGARDLDEFWRNIREGAEALEDFAEADLSAAGIGPELRNDPRFVGRGTALEQSLQWDAGFFGYSPREAQIIDPQQRIFLECAWEAMENAGYGAPNHGCAVGVYAGASMNTWLIAKLMRNPEVLAAAGAYQLMLGNDKDFLCTRVSYKLDLRGPSMTIQTACSTSLVAVEAACRAIVSNECDMALAGGVSITFPERSGYLHQEGMILSPDGHCRPFDALAAGTRAGAGAGIVVLKRFDRAVSDGDTIHAVIRGIAVNNDGAGKAGYTAPSLEGQVGVIATAQALAEVDPRTIGYMEAHGTATPLGDPIELAALNAAFRAGTGDIGFCRLGSLKANLGHLDAAAGVAGLIKAVLVLKNRELPPLVNFRTPNPTLTLHETPFTASAVAEPWLCDGPRRAAVSSFGIGGTNAHAVLEEAPPVARHQADDEDRLLVLSARTEAALDTASRALADHLETAPHSLADVAWTLQAGRKHFPCRRVVVGADRSEAARQLRAVHSAFRHEGGERPFAFLFPGQGSQHPGMGKDLYRSVGIYRDVVDSCAERLAPWLGLDIRDLMHGSDPAALKSTRIAQPALFVCSYALAQVWAARGASPVAMLGHSIGEYVAATLAGVFSLDDALVVVAERGRLMQSMPAGRMASVPLSPKRLAGMLGPGVEIAAVNAPDLCAIAGPADALAHAMQQLAANGIEARELQTSHAFHSAMMEPVLDEFASIVAGVGRSPPSLPYISNLTGIWITAEQATDPQYYARQLRGTVRFADGLSLLAEDPSLLFLECGPGQVLGQLARANFGGASGRLVVSSLSHPTSGASSSRTLLEATGRLWQTGVPVRLEELHGDGPRRRVPLPSYPFERQLYDVQPTAPAGSAIAPLNPGHLSISAPTWTRDPTGHHVTRLEGEWLVCGPSTGLREAVVAALSNAGAKAVTVADRAASKFGIAASSSETLAGVVMLSGLATAAGDAAFAELMELGSVLDTSERSSPLRIVVAARGAAGVLSERSVDVDATLALGPVLVLPTEQPHLAMRLVDLDGGDDQFVARALVAEACRPDEEVFTAWRAGTRWLRRLEPVSLPPEPVHLPRGGVYLITGGTGGIGLALAQWLAATSGARVLLTSRSVPDRETLQQAPGPQYAALTEAIDSIERSGGEVLLARADAADRTAMADAIATAQARWGKLNGVIHAAGVSGSNKLALRLTPDEVAATLAAKRGGLAVLRDILGAADLDFVALMGSINGVVGSPGASDYSAANAVLDGFAEFGEHPPSWRRVIAMDWGPWREVGMAHNRLLAQPPAARSAAVPGIGPAQGVDAFSRLLAGAHDRVVVTAFDLQAAVAASRNRETTGADEEVRDESASTLGDRSQVSLGGAFTPLSEGPEQILGEIWSELVGIANLGADDDFFELGGHSLMATRMLTRIEARFGVKLKLRDIFESSTIRELAAKLATPTGSDSDEMREEIYL
jgi:acyl transferase domain-containing protein/acyl carrier protein